jgi:uncharacterized membrane protein
MSMSDPSTQPSTASGNRGVMIVLSYLWILALIPLLTEKDDKDVQWHAKHGIVLLVAEVAFWIVFSILMNIIIAATLGLGCLLSLLGPFIGLAFLAIHIMAIMKGLNGQRFIVPYISEYADKF